MPMITKATRITNHSATLIDHIYTNSPEKIIKFGICLADISDHLPCFCTVSTMLPAFIHERYYRDFSHFDKELFEVVNLNKLLYKKTIVVASMSDSSLQKRTSVFTFSELYERNSLARRK